MGFSWEDQLRIPKGNGRFSGRWVDMPWRTATKLLKALADIDSSRGLFIPAEDGTEGNGRLRRAIGEALKAATNAEERSRGIDFDPADRELGGEATRVADALKRAYEVVHKDPARIAVADTGSGAEVEGEAKDAYLAEYADALLDAHRNADLFSSTDWSTLPSDDRSVSEEAALDNEFPLDGDSNLLGRIAKKAAWEVVEAIRDDDDGDDDGDGDGDGGNEPLPADPAESERPFGAPLDDDASPVGPPAPESLVDATLDALTTGMAAATSEAFRPDLADALRGDWRKGLLGAVQVNVDSVSLVAPDGSIVVTIGAQGELERGAGYDSWVEAAQKRYPGHRFWHSSESIVRDIATSPALSSTKEPVMSLQDYYAARLASLVAGAHPAEEADEVKAPEAPPPMLSLIAGAAPANPPAEWFTDPKLAVPTGVTVTPEGRIYGHVASWGICHIAHTNQCVTAPHSVAGYAYFHTGEVLTREGTRVATGRITLDTTHAGPQLNALSAAQHYEHTGAAVADVVAGEDQWGIWFSGAIRPTATEEQVRTLRASPLSGDWRRIDSGLEMIAALSVNVPGFPIPRTRGLVASGALQSLVASGMVAPTPPTTPAEIRAALAHFPRAAEDVAYLRELASRAAQLVADSAYAAEDCGCEDEAEDEPLRDGVFTIADLGGDVQRLANRLLMDRLAARVGALRTTSAPLGAPGAIVAYACNCKNKTRPMGGSATTNTTTARPRQSYTYTPPVGVSSTYGSLLEARAAAKRGGGGTIALA